MSELDNQIIKIILEHIAVCNKRFLRINKPEEFISLPDGDLILDGIAMRLLSIGENVKRIQNLIPGLQLKYPSINWDDIIRFRDFISHHYEFLDFDTCFTNGELRKEN
jgi:uncharacterized protein with HEPN domain